MVGYPIRRLESLADPSGGLMPCLVESEQPDGVT